MYNAVELFYPPVETTVRPIGVDRELAETVDGVLQLMAERHERVARGGVRPAAAVASTRWRVGCKAAVRMMVRTTVLMERRTGVAVGMVTV